jgi:DNA processing protein
MINHPLAAKIAINLIPGIGDINAKKLIAYCGSLDAVFKEKKEFFEKIPGIGEVIASKLYQSIQNSKLWNRVEEEIAFCEKYKINVISYFDENYPQRLAHCEDSPVTLFSLGNPPFNMPHVLSIVGTRKATAYGRKFCDELIAHFKERNLEVLIVSGLAYGIDIAAHKAALKNNLPTVAVLAHGLDMIYPAAHREYAQKMMETGGLVSDFLSKTTPDRANFVKRNRIVAGLSDATLVVESKKDGGAMITADIAFSYNRDVLAVPGRITDSYSEGSHYLIKSNKAALVENAEDVCHILGWSYTENTENLSNPLVFELTDDENIIVAILKEQGDLTLDLLALNAQMPVSKVSVTLLNMEFKGIIKSLPGKVYSLCVKL